MKFKYAVGQKVIAKISAYSLNVMGEIKERTVTTIADKLVNIYNINDVWFREDQLQSIGADETQSSLIKKIIGYKAPYDLFGGRIRKGEIFKQDEGYNNVYMSKGNLAELHKLPKELVETWEPVYEETSIDLVIGNPAKTVNISIGKIECEGKEILLKPIQILASINNNLAINIINHWDVSIPAIKIGCATFSIQELNAVLSAYNKLNDNL